MKRTALALILVAITAGPALAQGKGKNKQKAVPPGHVPPAGLCRVRYDGVPPGRQPAPTSCYEAERIAAQTGSARVVYGDGSRSNAPIYRDQYPTQYPSQYPGDIRRDDGNGRYPSTDGRRPNPNGQTTGRTAGRVGQYPDSYPNTRANYSTEAFRKGYGDGVYKGREDVGDGDSFDPARHSWYKNADRGYNSRFGTKDQYREEYRRGFLDGYENTHTGRQQSQASRPSWWPF